MQPSRGQLQLRARSQQALAAGVAQQLHRLVRDRRQVPVLCAQTAMTVVTQRRKGRRPASDRTAARRLRCLQATRGTTLVTLLQQALQRLG